MKANRKMHEDNQDKDREKKWYDEFEKEAVPCKHTKTEVEVMGLKDNAKKHLEAETAAFQLKQSKTRDSELEWLKTALAKGVNSDKIAASIVLIQDHPKYNLSRLVSLVSQVRASKHSQSSMLITSLKELFTSNLLHPEHKLLLFEEQDLDKLDTLNADNKVDKVSQEAQRKKLLAHWYFEDQLKEQYHRFITALSTVASDTVDANREKAVAVMTDLLIANAEQEHKLLELLINKIGDPHSKVSSKAVFCISKLLLEHPNMKIVVLREIEKLLFRTNVSQRAQYYAICLLTQFVLDREDLETANSLIDVYFAFFKACLKRGEPDSKMMAAILTGVNRAYPFANVQSTKLHSHIDSVYKVVHIGSFNVSLNALCLLHQVVGTEPEQESRFYTAFYRKLLDLQIGVANKRAIFLNLLYRVLRRDKSVVRICAFLKRILQVALYFPPSMACATLYVVSQVMQARKDLQNLMSTTYNAVKHEEEDADEVVGLDVVSDGAKSGENSENSDEEPEAKAQLKDDNIILSNIVVEPIPSSESLDGTLREVNVESDTKVEDKESTFYNPFCLNPLRAGAMMAPFAELEVLSKHFHPSVALFASTIVQGKPIHYTGDPLEDLNLIRFLDRYVFKNPKKLEDKRIAKVNDPLAQRAKYTPRGVKMVPVDSQAYLNEKEDRIPVDELFLYRYLQKKNELRGSYVKTEHDDDNDSVNSEEFNEMLDSLGGGGGKDFDDLDIAADIGPTKKKKARHSDDDDDVEDGDSDEPDISDNDEEFNEDVEDFDPEDMDDIDLEGLDDDDFSDMEFNDDDSFDEDSSKVSAKSKGKSSKKGNTKDKKKGGINSNVFVSAEEFAEMLEEQGRSKIKHGSSNALSDADGAGVKQLDWETSRNQRLVGKKRPHSKNFKGKKNIKKFKRKF